MLRPREDERIADLAALEQRGEEREHLQIFERLTREDQNRDRGLLQKSLTKEQD